MKKALWLIPFIAFMAFSINTYLDRKSEQRAEKEKILQKESEVKAGVNNLLLKYGASDNWEAQLSRGEKFRLEPILTIELQKAWIKPEPILFIGAIKDVGSINEKDYLVKVERSIYNNMAHMYGTVLELSLVADAENMESFLNSNPDIFTDYGFNNGVAVIAQISEIESSEIIGEDGVREEIKIGRGALLDIAYTGDTTF